MPERDRTTRARGNDLPPLVLRFINTVSHRERRCAAPARRATEAYSQQYGARSAYFAGADAAALECNRICETEYLATAHFFPPLLMIFRCGKNTGRFVPGEGGRTNTGIHRKQSVF